MRRRSFALAAAGAALPLAWREALAANEFPARPIQVIVPYAAGGADIYIRPLQPALEKKHGVRLVIESVVGAGGTVGAARVKRAAPDGDTQAGAPVAADFVPLLNLVTIPYFIATKKGSPIRDLRGLTDFIKSRPGALSYGSPGFGTSPHLGMEALARKLGSSVTHIPFSGVATAMQSLLGGHIDAIIGAPSTVIPQVEAGTVSAVVVVSKDRFPLAPDVPSLAEAGIDLDVSTHFAFYAPKGTPAPIAARLALALSDAATDPAFRQALEATRTRIDVLPADVLARVLAEESARFGPLVSAVKS
jgi:tripartite-type tricarboxylate transporter receptor subunit TctC